MSARASCLQRLRFRRELDGDLARRKLAPERGCLSRPHRGKIAGALRLCFGVQRCQRAAGERKLRRDRIDRSDLPHHTVDETARRPAGHQIGHGRTVVMRRTECRAMRRQHRRFRTMHVGAADLHGRGAERQRRHDPARVRDGAGGDHRHLHRVHHLRHQRKGADLRRQIVGQEHAAMAAGLVALGDDDVAAVLL
jgi:hypothetical protein